MVGVDVVDVAVFEYGDGQVAEVECFLNGVACCVVFADELALLVIDEVCCAACGVQGGVDFDVDADEVLYVDLAVLVAVGVVAGGGAEDMVKDEAVVLGVDEAVAVGVSGTGIGDINAGEGFADALTEAVVCVADATVEADEAIAGVVMVAVEAVAGEVAVVVVLIAFAVGALQAVVVDGGGVGVEYAVECGAVAVAVGVVTIPLDSLRSAGAGEAVEIVVAVALVVGGVANGLLCDEVAGVGVVELLGGVA